MSEDALKLSVYFGERDRLGDRLLADVLVDIFERRSLRISLLMRGTEGFGAKHHLRTDRTLTLSEDLPLVAVAVDAHDAVQEAVADVEALPFDGLITLERARLQGEEPIPEPAATNAQKLTVYLGRQERIDGRPGYEVIVELLHAHGAAAVIVLLGVDGTTYGTRRRAAFFSGNVQVPLMIMAVGERAAMEQARAALAQMLTRPLVTVEKLTLCKRGPERLVGLEELSAVQARAPGMWQKLMIHAGEQVHSGDQSLHDALIRALRRAGAAGATSLRGIWGYQGDEPPHGDSFWQLRRRVPMLTYVIDTPERIAELWAIIERVTGDETVLTTEFVPAFRATSAGIRIGHLELGEQ